MLIGWKTQQMQTNKRNMLPIGCLGYSGNSYPPRWSFHYLQISSCLLLQRCVVHDSIPDSKEFNGHCFTGTIFERNSLILIGLINHFFLSSMQNVFIIVIF